MGALRYVVGGLTVLALIYAGYKAAGWRADAMQLEGAKLELRNEIQRRVASDAARLSVEERMRAVEEAWAKKVGATIKVIREHAPNNPDCSVIPDDVASQLSVLREGQR